MSRGTQVPAVSFSVSGTGLSPALAELSSSFPLPTHESHMPVLQPRLNESSRFGLIPFRSPLLWESRLISFPSGTEMFHFPASWRSTLYVFRCPRRSMTSAGFPHSDIPGSSDFSFSPRLFAAYHVFHRLWRQGIHRTLLLTSSFAKLTTSTSQFLCDLRIVHSNALIL